MSQRQDWAVVTELLKSLSTFLQDKSLYEVIVNRPGQVLTEGPGGWRTHEMPELTFEKLMRLARAIASFSHQSIDETHPILSATLPGGERIQIVIPPATVVGTVSMTIRKPSSIDFSLDDLEENGFFQTACAANDILSTQDEELGKAYRAGRFKDFLRLAVIARKNIIISGATGSAKTTLSKALIKHIPKARGSFQSRTRLSLLFHNLTTCGCSTRKEGRGFRMLDPKSFSNPAFVCDQIGFCFRSFAMGRPSITSGT